jgi:CRP/FNR family transcriptional regulator
MTPDAPSILNGCRLFHPVSAANRECLLAMARTVQYAAGTTIFRQGQDCPGIYVVGTGLVQIYQIGPAGKQHVLHLVGPGYTFAEAAALGGYACPAWAESIEETMGLLLPREPFRRALEQNHVLCLELLGSFAQWVRHFVNLVEDIALRDAIGRVARYLSQHVDKTTAEVRLSPRKKHVASHLNLTAETLSRTLRRLSDEGLISSADGRTIQVRDLPGLLAAADGGFPRT